MLLLALETATPTGGAALLEDGRVLGSLVIDEARAHSRLLLPFVEKLLGSHGRTVADLDVVAVSRGPGTFTGVRVGMALAKGLCALGERPRMVCVSSLEALAHRAWAGTPDAAFDYVLPLLNARRGEVYGGLFRPQGDRLVLEGTEFALPPEAVLTRWRGRCLAAGQGLGVYAAVFAALPPDSIVHAASGHSHPHPESLARLALRVASEGRFDDPATAAPTYLRPVLVGGTGQS